MTIKSEFSKSVGSDKEMQPKIVLYRSGLCSLKIIVALITVLQCSADAKPCVVNNILPCLYIWTTCQKNLIFLENCWVLNVPPQMPASWLRLGLVLVTGPRGGWGPGAGGCQPITGEYGQRLTNERRVLWVWSIGELETSLGRLRGAWSPDASGRAWPALPDVSPKSQAERGHCLVSPGSPEKLGTRDKPSRLCWQIGFIHLNNLQRYRFQVSLSDDVLVSVCFI